MEKIIFATKNKGKIKEIKEILKTLDVEVISMEEAGITLDVVEDGETFEENALKKAREIMMLSKQVVMADDSGLEVDYLDKAPGVYSARFGGENTSYAIKNQMILEKLRNVPWEQRRARFVSVIVTVFPDGNIRTTRGTIEGYIAYEAKGNQGFGYDPIFYVPEYHCTLAELTLEEKNKISHRGKALEKMKRLLKEELN